MAIKPMLAMAAPPPVGGTWSAEPKFDGERIIAIKEKGQKVQLWTRRGIEVGYKFPEVVAALESAIVGEYILDGELVVEGGFQALLKRSTQDPAMIRFLMDKTPARYHIFDVLKAGPTDLRNDTPLDYRKQILGQIVRPHPVLPLVRGQLVQSVAHLDALMADALKNGYEGLVVKQLNSRYYENKRSPTWVKMKKSDTVDAWVIGATRCTTNAFPFGALILWKDGKYYGKVGTGFDIPQRQEIISKVMLNPTEVDYASFLPSDVQSEVLCICKPLACEIKMQEEFKDGTPRHPVWVRWRNPK